MYVSWWVLMYTGSCICLGVSYVGDTLLLTEPGRSIQITELSVSGGSEGKVA